MGETLATELLGDAGRRREARRRSAHEFRKRRAFVAAAVAALMAVIGGLGSAEIVARQNGRYILPQRWTDLALAELHRLLWSDPQVQLTGFILIGTGMIVLLYALSPGRARMEPIRVADAYTAAALTSEGLSRALTDAALGIPGVDRASVRVGRRVTVRAYTPYRNPGNIADLVRAAVTSRLEEIDPIRSRRVAVKLTWRH